MTESQGNIRPQELAARLRRLVAERAAAEGSLAAELAAKKQAAQKQHEEAQKEAATRYQRERTDTEAEYKALRSEIVEKFRTDQSALKEEYDGTCSEIISRTEDSESAAQRGLQDAQWQATTVFEAAKNSLDGRMKEAQAQLAAMEQQLAALRQEAEQVLLLRKRQGEVPVAVEPDPSPQASPAQRFAALVASVRSQMQAMCSQAGL